MLLKIRKVNRKIKINARLTGPREFIKLGSNVILKRGTERIRVLFFQRQDQ